MESLRGILIILVMCAPSEQFLHTDAGENSSASGRRPCSRQSTSCASAGARSSGRSAASLASTRWFTCCGGCRGFRWGTQDHCVFAVHSICGLERRATAACLRLRAGLLACQSNTLM